MNMALLSLSLALFLFAQLVQPSLSFDIDNSILGDPEIQCGSDTVEMQFRTEKPFRGNVYVKGQYNDPGCRENFNESPFTTRPIAGIVIPHGTCHMERQRMINPENGMQFSAIVVISFHPKFITKIDRAFHIKCMYRELSRTVEQGIEVSALATTPLSHEFPVPTCRYTIHKDEIDGEILKYASVGELVVHRWECDGSDVYGLLVHSCFVEDGQGEKVMVIDNDGCQVDDYILGEPTYTEALNMAYREAHVIKFADRVTVRFMCQIRLCMKTDGGCDGITPPICSRPHPVPRAQTSGFVEPNLHSFNNRVNSSESSTSSEKFEENYPYYTGGEASHLENESDYYPQENTTPVSSTPSSTESSTTRTTTIGDLPTPGAIRRRFFYNQDPTPKSLRRKNIQRYNTDQSRPTRPPRYSRYNRPRSQHRFYRSVAVGNQNDTQNSPSHGLALLGFRPVDGDFMSQMLYVLDSTEEPPTKGDEDTKNLFLRRANSGGIVATGSENRFRSNNEVCLSVTLFSVLMGALTCVFVGAAFIATFHCCRKLSIFGGDGVSPSPFRGSSATSSLYPGNMAGDSCSDNGKSSGGLLSGWTDKVVHKLYKP